MSQRKRETLTHSLQKISLLAMAFGTLITLTIPLSGAAQPERIDPVLVEGRWCGGGATTPPYSPPTICFDSFAGAASAAAGQAVLDRDYTNNPQSNPAGPVVFDRLVIPEPLASWGQPPSFQVIGILTTPDGQFERQSGFTFVPPPFQPLPSLESGAWIIGNYTVVPNTSEYNILSNHPVFMGCSPPYRWNILSCELFTTLDTKKNLGCDEDCMVGNPVNPLAGNKVETAIDYSGNGPFPLTIERRYNSIAATFLANFGLRWTDNYSKRITASANAPGPHPKTAYATRADGRVFTFYKTGATWESDLDVQHKLEALLDNNSVVIGWRLKINEDDSVETYDAAGRLTSISNRQLLTHTLTYGTNKRINTITDSFGRTLQYSYIEIPNLGPVVSQITNPAGGIHQYSYDANGNLKTVTHPDNTVTTYNHVNRLTNTIPSTTQTLLSGITDELGNQYASFDYDLSHRVSLTRHGTAENPVNKHTFVYTGARVDITDPRNVLRLYFQTFLNNTRQLTSIVGTDATPATAQCPSCGPALQSYDANGNVQQKRDYNGNRTNYTYDLARNLEATRTEGLTAGGAATTATRTISTQWHSTYRLPIQIAEPLRITTIVYGDSSDQNPGNRGNVLSKSVQATTDANGAAGFGATPTGAPRIWSYTYNANGSLLTANGPRTDVSDVSTYTYYANNESCSGVSTTGCRGQIATITNAAGHVNNITSYNAHGQPLSITDSNGLITTLAYDARSRLTSRSAGTETTSFLYDNAGQLIKITFPDSSYLQNSYDLSHRLIQVADNLGNKISYTLDQMGNRIQEDIFDPANELTKTRARVYNNFNRLAEDITAGGHNYAYDAQGNVTQIIGPLAATVTTNIYDALNRITRSTNPLSGQTNYSYNGVNRLASVTDPRSLTTNFGYDGLNNLNQLISPDTGTSINSYDAAGNLVNSTDGKGQVTTYTYDALNRATSITYQGGVVHNYTYDQGSNGKGRLTQIAEPNSVTDYVYSPQGRLLTETRTINGVPYVTAYSYDSAGRINGMTYPSGRQINYTLNSLGQIQSVATTKDSNTQTVISNVAYRPFGPSTGFTFGNGETYARTFDQEGRISSYTTATQTMVVYPDYANRINYLFDANDGNNFTIYDYDKLDRLTSFFGPNTNQIFTFDASGNRTTKTVGSNTDTYTYSNTSNKLSSITGNTNRTYSYDANGSTTGDTANTYSYDTRGRLAQTAGIGGASTYKVNSIGQRIRKSNSQGDTIYHYDSQGRLISETSSSGTPQREYIYLGDTPVAVIQ